MTTQPMPNLYLKQVAHLIACHPRTLRLKLSNEPERVPPAIRVADGPERHHYEFRAEDVTAWLVRRDEMRRKSGKPWLTWLAPGDSSELTTPVAAALARGELKASETATAAR